MTRSSSNSKRSNTFFQHYVEHAERHSAVMQGIGSLVTAAAAIFALCNVRQIGSDIASLSKSTAILAENKVSLDSLIASSNSNQKALRELARSILDMRTDESFGKIDILRSRPPSKNAGESEILKFKHEVVEPALPKGATIDNEKLLNKLKEYRTLDSDQQRLLFFRDFVIEE